MSSSRTKPYHTTTTPRAARTYHGYHYRRYARARRFHQFPVGPRGRLCACALSFVPLRVLFLSAQGNNKGAVGGPHCERLGARQKERRPAEQRRRGPQTKAPAAE
ncbi:hypothetical protein MRX96_047049 [Rhipicephalus microplus]